MSSECKVKFHGPEELGDAFCELYDAAVQEPLGALDWMDKPEASRLSGAIAREALAGTFALGRPAPPGWSEHRWRLIQLQGLDEFLKRVRSGIALGGGGVEAPDTVLALIELYEETGRLSRHASGALLPRMAFGSRNGFLPDRLRDAFESIVRVPESVWASIRFSPLSSGHEDLSRREVVDGIRFGCVPFLELDDDYVVNGDVRRGVRVFSVEPRDTPRLKARIGRVLKTLDEADVQIGVLPEGAASPSLLEVWQEEIANPGRPPSKLRWLLIGSGHFSGKLPPDNTAILLDARTGEVMAAQGKQKHNIMTAEEVAHENFPPGVVGAVEENLEPREELIVMESRIGRLAILICEDLASAARIGGTLDAVGVSLVLAPLLASPLREGRWSERRADLLRDDIGATIVVSNSLVIGRRRDQSGPLPASMVIGPGFMEVGHASDPEDLMIYDLDLPALGRWRQAA